MRITKAPNNTFSKIFNSRELDCNGKFSFLKITDEMVYALVYKKGNFFSASSFKKKPQSSSAANSVQQQCYDVYWVTYYDDGRSRWDYMYSYCDDQCNTTKKFNDMATTIACGGGGSEEEEEEVIKGADYEWTVQNIPADFGSGWLRQLNRLVAKFNNRRPERNHFLGGSATSINLYANSWGENGTVGYSNTSTPVTVNSNTQVTVASSGTIRFFINDITYDYSGSKALPLSCCNWQ